MDLLDLPYPNASHFQQSYGSQLDGSLYITRGFLKPRYADTTDMVTKKKKEYIDELIQQIENREIAFRRLVISNETLTEVAISLHRDYTEKEAERCLREVQSRDVFEVIQTSKERFERAVSHFERLEDKNPNFGEFIDYQVMQDKDIQHLATWDTDFTTFGQITMLPVTRWGV